MCSHLCIAHSKIKILFKNKTIFNQFKYTNHRITGDQGTRIDLNTATSTCITFLNIVNLASLKQFSNHSAIIISPFTNTLYKNIQTDSYTLIVKSSSTDT